MRHARHEDKPKIVNDWLEAVHESIEESNDLLRELIRIAVSGAPLPAILESTQDDKPVKRRRKK